MDILRMKLLKRLTFRHFACISSVLFFYGVTAHGAETCEEIFSREGSSTTSLVFQDLETLAAIPQIQKVISWNFLRGAFEGDRYTSNAAMEFGSLAHAIEELKESRTPA